MKIHILIALIMVISLMFLPIACTPEAIETSGATDTQVPIIPPSSEELAKDNFVLPEIPRILCEQLKQMMDRGDDFVLVDARASNNFKRGYIPGAINIPEDNPSPPFTEEWVNDQLTALPKDNMTIFYCD